MAKVLELDTQVAKGTDHYIDDILVNEDIVSVQRVIDHLSKFGLKTKPPARLEVSRVLGLQLRQDDKGELLWTRGNVVPEIDHLVSRRKLFSICGQLVGHYPIAGWLRVACGYVKRCAEGTRWTDLIGDNAQAMLVDMLQRVKNEDPVKGVWACKNQNFKGRIWCDASSISVGCALEINDQIVEDAAWLRKKDDTAHINAERGKSSHKVEHERIKHCDRFCNSVWLA